MKVLPDTSVWVNFLRIGPDGPAGELDRLLDRREVVVCGPVAAELLAGADENRRDELRQLLASLPWADIDRARWGEVGSLVARLRATGRSVALTDIEIAVAAMGAAASVWTFDANFDRIAEQLPELHRFEPSFG